jgi:methionyl-tRNA formyltransferase
MNIYAGNYHEVLETFHHLKGVDHVIAERRNIENEIIEFCKRENIEISLVQTSDDVTDVAEEIGNISLCLIASFGLILKKPFIDRTNLIMNIHPGSLYNSRGRHPLPFAISKGLSFMTLTAHLIQDEKIDHGPIMMEINLPIDYYCSYNENDQRLRSCLPYVTDYILRNLNRRMEMPVLKADLRSSVYNKPLDKEELSSMMNAKTLEAYKK